jgi:hypothetical protein
MRKARRAGHGNTVHPVQHHNGVRLTEYRDRG